MARGYSRYEYETSPRKLEPYYASKKKETDNKKQKDKKAKATKKQQPILEIPLTLMEQLRHLQVKY